MDSTLEFDQIIFSSSGCYGSCPIIDLSITRSNEVFFQGEGYVEPLGFYESQIDNGLTSYIFNKFEKSNIKDLSNNYSANHSDDESIITTFIKNGKIVKTINYYGIVGPK
jgi:hypothetical protein